MNITVRQVVRREDEAAWDEYVGENQNATGYHLTAWRHVVARVFGHRTLYLMATGAQGEVKGILPFVSLSSPLFGSFFVSLPYFNYGGLLADGDDVRDALLTTAVACAKEHGASHIELRHTTGPELAWPRKDHKVSMRLDLPQRFDDLLKVFPPKLRSQIRRGEKEGMTTQIGGLELLDDFYRVFSLNMRDLGTPVYGRQFFGEILGTFSKDAKICCVRLGSKPVAAALVYGFRQTLEIPWASSDRRYARSAPNMLLYNAVLKYACEQGYRVFDFGRSSKDSGTYRFKEQWGAKPLPLYWYYWLPKGTQLPELNPQNPKYQLAIRIWQHLPVPLTQFVGPMIAKYLP